VESVLLCFFGSSAKEERTTSFGASTVLPVSLAVLHSVVHLEPMGVEDAHMGNDASGCMSREYQDGSKSDGVAVQGRKIMMKASSIALICITNSLPYIVS